MTEAIMVTITFDSAEKANEMARLILERRLAACIQVLGPVTSTYRWNGPIESAQEWLALIKTRHEHFESLELLVKEHHSYEVPEILAVPIVAGSRDYLDWLMNETE
ncbi:MAG: divalent-cation tolerance protein CutA [Candidatus Sumerlaeia bacterium]